MRTFRYLVLLLALCLLNLCAFPAHAQVITIDMFTDQGTVKLKVLEEGSEKPVEYVSVYLSTESLFLS